ncbi:MAG: glycine cleavage system aminomethyltransferase GcvT, partial [Proteobacteria bacterium]|nr:glycine cleavage system aminomethyltransferase GcvT [Pseudomonadota bacterium]
MACCCRGFRLPQSGVCALTAASEDLLKTPLHSLHLELGARMVPFAGYSMPVQYPSGLMAEHKHTREGAGLFDISHMGQLRLQGPDAAAAFESLMPVDVIGLAPGKQRYGLLLNDEGGILDDLMFFNEGNDLGAKAPSGGSDPHAMGARGGQSFFVIVNGACKAADLAFIRERIGQRCNVVPMPDHALLALQGPQAAAVLARLSPGIERFVFMTGGAVQIGGIAAFATRSGYTGEDGFEISVAADQAEALARLLLAQAEVKPIGLGARNSLRLEAGLCLYGNDIDTTTTPVEASLNWAIQKVRRQGGAREGGFPGAGRILDQLAVAADLAGHVDQQLLTRRRVGLVAL